MGDSEGRKRARELNERRQLKIDVLMDEFDIIFTLVSNPPFTELSAIGLAIHGLRPDVLIA